MKQVFVVLIFFSICSFAIAVSEIRIGYIGGLTGGGSQSAQKSLKAAQMAVADANKNGGLLGRQIKLFSYDNKTAPSENISLFRKIQSDGIVGLTGVHYSNDGLLLAELAEKGRIPLVVASATHPGITNGRTYVVRVCFTDDEQAAALSRIAQKRFGAKRVITVVDVSNSFTEYLASAFERKFHSLGGTVIRTFPIRTDENDFRSIVSEIKNLSSADLLFVSAAAIESGYLTAQLVSSRVRIPVLGNDGWQNDNLKQVLQNLRVALFDAVFTVHWHQDVKTKQSEKFISEFRAKFRESVNSFDADTVLTYDSTRFLLESIRKAQSTDAEKIAANFRSVRLNGVTGQVWIGEKGNPIKPIELLKISRGTVARDSVGVP